MSRDRVRLGSGRFQGVSLPVPRGVRPTSSRVRKALLDRWQFRLAGAELLELFAGTGAVGLEALGRGAESLLALDHDPRVVRSLERAVAERASGAAEVRRARLPEELGGAVGERRFDLVFADPPYEIEDLEPVLEAAGAVLDEAGEIVVEHSRRRRAPERVGRLERVEQRRYGESVLSVYRPRK